MEIITPALEGSLTIQPKHLQDNWEEILQILNT